MIIILPSLFQTDLPVRERIFLLLDATQTALGGASGKFPQYYAAYYELVVGADCSSLKAIVSTYLLSMDFYFLFSASK